MPTTPIYGLPYQCMGATFDCESMGDLALAAEAGLVTLNAEATAVTHVPNARVTGNTATALNVDATLVYTLFPTFSSVSGFTFNAAAGTFTIITPGLYLASMALSGNQSTLTMSSQRASVVVNGAVAGTKKYRGTNPVTVLTLIGTWSQPIGPLLAGDVVTFRYFWTGTGALNGDATVRVHLSLLATP